MRDGTILLAHGAGGRKSAELTRDVFLPVFGNPALNVLGDSAVVEACGQRLAFSTDSFVVSPLFFPGGDVGTLAVCGTVNDIACAGARPIALSAAFILEEGLSVDTLERVAGSMQSAANKAGVRIVTGDTKVVPRGSADGLFITTSGIGLIATGTQSPSPCRATPGDIVIVSGTVADHGMAVMTAREGLELLSAIRSDCAPLNGLVGGVLAAAPHTNCLRDPTRGGLAAVLNEIAEQSGVCIEINEQAVPLNENTRVACELLGIDPLHVANEGKLVVITPASEADSALAAMRGHRYGRNAAVIGSVQANPPGRVHLRTGLGSLRILDMPAGDLLPRIC